MGDTPVVHCWTARYEALGFEWAHDALLETNLSWDELHAICMLPDGHKGEHDFVGQDEIVVTFPEASHAR